MQDKQNKGKAPQQVEDTEYVDLSSGETVNRNPIKELMQRVKAKLEAVRNFISTDGLTTLEKHYGKNMACADKLKCVEYDVLACV